MSGPIQKQPSKTERIRGPRLEIFRRDVTFDEAIRIADAENRVLPSNRRIDQEIMDGKYKALLSFAWTGTLIVHAEAGKPLGKNIIYTDPTTHHRWIFPVPEDLQEKTDCVLVTEHPHYRIEIDRNDLIIHASYLAPLEGFPQEDGGYRTDPHHCIPLGEKVGPDDPGIRYLTGRMYGYGAVVPVHRRILGANTKHIFLFRPSSTYDMIVEAPAEEQKGAVPMPAQEEAKKKGILAEGNWTVDQILLLEVNILRDMLGTNSPESIFSQVKSDIDFLVTSFKLAKAAGSDTRSLVRASNALGNFVTKELASDPRYEHLVPELRKYYAQKLREVLK